MITLVTVKTGVLRCHLCGNKVMTVHRIKDDSKKVLPEIDICEPCAIGIESGLANRERVIA